MAVFFPAQPLASEAGGLAPGAASPADPGLASSQLDMFDFKELDSTTGIDFKDLIVKAVSGQLDLSLSNLGKRAAGILFHEITDNWRLIRNLMVIVVLCAVLQNLTDSFKNKGVGELGFYVGYMALVMVLFASFTNTIGIMTGVVKAMSDIMAAAIPIALGLLAISGSLSSASMFSPLFAFVIEALTLFVRHLLTPMLIFSTGLEIVNFLTEKKPLSNFAELIRKIADWSIKTIAVVFLAVLSIQRLSAPILNNVAMKTAKSAANAIPVVGGMISGAFDAVVYWGQAAKSGMLVALVIALVIAVSVPILKILAMLIIYKLTAAIVQPISDERIVDCLTSIGKSCALILQAGVTVAVMFIVSVVVLLAV
jgi:stage III sporulation protein AE